MGLASKANGVLLLVSLSIVPRHTTLEAPRPTFWFVSVWLLLLLLIDAVFFVSLVFDFLVPFILRACLKKHSPHNVVLAIMLSSHIRPETPLWLYSWKRIKEYLP